MKIFSFEESLKELNKDIDEMTKEMQNKAKESMELLAAQAHGKIIEKATDKLHSRREQYIQALVGPENIGDNIWVVGLKKEAAWIEEGKKAGSLLDDLLASPKAKVSKEGHRYIRIPFEHSKKPSSMSRSENRIANYVKSELKKMKLDKIVRDQKGDPKMGRVATVDLTGEGAPISKFNKPLLKGLTIYQRQTGTTAKGHPKIQRDVMTFRTASEKQIGSGLWYHPGLDGVRIFDEVEKELDKMWDEMVRKFI